MFSIKRFPPVPSPCLAPFVIAQPTVLASNKQSVHMLVGIPRAPLAKELVLDVVPSRMHGSKLTLLWIGLCVTAIWPGWSSAQTPLTNTPVTEAQIAHFFTSQKPVLYFCQTGILDDLGNLDGGWGEPPSPGRITSAAWDIGDNRYLYAYQLTNPNFLDDNVPFAGGWDVAVFGHSNGLRIPLGHKQITPVDFDGDQLLDTSFRTTDHACNALFDQPNPGCAPFTGPFKVFTVGADDCARSWSDYYTFGEQNDAIVDAFVNFNPAGLSAEFAVQFNPFCCAYGIFRSTQVFGFVTDAPPAYVDGVNLGGASASVRIVAPVPRVLLVPGICGNAADWDPFEDVLVDSGFVVYRLQYGSQDFSLQPKEYVNILDAMLKGMGAGRVAVVGHSMGGLIAREYMRRTRASENKIGQLVTLGTPHHGSDLLALLLAWGPVVDGLISPFFRNPCLTDALSKPALRDMVPGAWFLNHLNYGTPTSNDSLRGHGWDTHDPETTLPANVYLASIGGTGSFCNARLRKFIWRGGSAYHPNDCTVATGGSLLANTSTFRAADPGLSLEKPATHADAGTKPCGQPYYEFGTLAQRTARVLLTSPAGLPLSPATLQPSLGVSTTLTTVEDSLQMAPAIADSIPAGQIVNKTVAIPATSLARFALLSTDAHLSLLDPNGTAITVSDTSSTSGITFFSTDDPGFEGFEIVGPLPGTWTMRINTSASTGGQRIAGIVDYASGSAVRLSVASSLIHPGDVMQVHGQLVDGGTLRTDVTWSCSTLGPNGASSALALYDDGAHGDGQSADGVYGNAVTPGGGIGLYSLTAGASAPGVGPLAASAYCELADVQDLVIESDDIYLSNNVPQAGDSLTVYATVHNNSSKPALAVTVEIRDLRADTILGTSTVDLAAQSAVTVQAPWVPAPPDSHQIEVQVSPYVLDESDYSNNTASRVIVLGSPVSVDFGSIPAKLRFDPPYPNPTLRGLVFSFSLPQRSAASLDVFDILGRRVQGWRWASMVSGSHSVEWDGQGTSGQRLATGVYLCQLKVGSERLQRRIVLRR